MNIESHKETIHHSSPFTHYSLFAAASVAVTLASVLCAAGKYSEATAAGLVTLASGYALSARVSVESILIFWFATTPLVSFYARFPLDRSIITYNRAVIFLIVMMLLLKSRSESRASDSKSEISNVKFEISNPESDKSSSAGQQSSRFSVTKFEIAWALVSVLALVSAVFESTDVTYAAKLAVDTFFLPLVMFNVARNRFDARGRTGALMLSAIALAFFLFSTGAYEFATGINLFPYKGSVLVREGERRVNGPFLVDSSYAMISLFLALFLQVAPRLLRVKLDRTTRLLYSCAIAVAALASLLSLFRATAIALVIGFIILKFAGREKQRIGGAEVTDREPSHPVTQSVTRSPNRLRSAWAVAAALIVIIGVMSLGYFSFGGRLTNPRNAFGRLATWETAAKITAENPLFGVGLTNYSNYFHAEYNWEDESVERVMSTRAADTPHSNLFWIAAELGVFAFLLYAAANVYLFLTGWRALKRAADLRARSAAACYLALFVAYWIHGLTLASGYYSDTNLYFFFLLGLLSNKSLVSDS